MKVFFATPVHDTVHPLHARSVLEASRVLLDHGSAIAHAWAVGLDVDEARQRFFREFLQSDADALFMVDADIGFEPDLVVRMAALQEELVSAAVPVRSVNVEDAVESGRTTEALFFAGEPGFKTQEEGFGIRKGRDWCLTSSLGSTALMFLSRKGAETMERAHPGQAFETMIREDLAMGEDLSFFTRWTELGGKIWILLSSLVSHSGPVTVQGNCFYCLNEAKSHPKIVRSWPYEEKALPGDLR